MNPLTIFIPTRNHHEKLKACIQSYRDVAKQDGVPVTFIIVDGSDEPVEIPNVKICRLQGPRKCVVSEMQAAFPFIETEYVLMVADDTIPRSGSLIAAVQYMDWHPDVGLGAPYFTDRDDHFGCRVNCTLFGTIYAQLALVRVSAGNAIGWWDTSYRMYAADHDFSLKMLAGGFGVTPVPGCCIIMKDHFDAVKSDNSKHVVDEIARLNAKWVGNLGFPKVSLRKGKAIGEALSWPIFCPKGGKREHQ